MFVVVAAFEVNPANRERFLAVAQEDATMSVEREPGCRQFDVCVDPEREGSIQFYEVYDIAGRIYQESGRRCARLAAGSPRRKS